MEIPRKKYYTLGELTKRWEKYSITEFDILNMATEGKLLFSVWYNGDTLSFRDGVTEEEMVTPNKETLVPGFKKEMVYLPRSEAMAFVAKDKVSVSCFLDKDYKKFRSHVNFSPGPLLGKTDVHEYLREELCLEYNQVLMLDASLEADFTQLQTEQSESPKQQTVSNSSNPQDAKKSGAPKSSLRKAVEYLYDISVKEGNTDILQKGKIVQFIKKLQAVKKSPPDGAARDIFDNIKEVKLSGGKWKISTEDRVLKVTNSRELNEKPKTYLQNDISKILSRLRKQKPLTP